VRKSSYHVREVYRGPIAIVGPTASGKTRLALDLMELRPHYEAVSVDSMTIYKEFSVGTAKPTETELAGHPYHLISVVSVVEEFSLAEFITLVQKMKEEIERRFKTALYVGGTSLYLRAVVDGLTPQPTYSGLRLWLETVSLHLGQGVLYQILKTVDPKAASKILSTNDRRVIRALEVSLGSGMHKSIYGEVFSNPDGAGGVLQFGVKVSREVLYKRIEERIHLQLEQGWIDEVAAVIESDKVISRTAAQAIGYKELAAYLRGELDYHEAVALTVRRTKNLAKRQLAWLRRDSRILWIETLDEVLERLDGTQ